MVAGQSLIEESYLSNSEVYDNYEPSGGRKQEGRGRREEGGGRRAEE
jgi:hypothetical protein